MITGSVDIIVQASRLRDGSRKITHITEVLGMEGEVVTLQNLLVYEITGRRRQRQAHRPPPLDRHRASALLGARRSTTARQNRLAEALAASEVADRNGNPMGESNG
ncbi:MAG: hypothetical protein QM784_05565 [Polyangiaceae bacterium]